MRYIKLSTDICKWEWFTDGNMLKLWIYLLTNAQQFKETRFKGLVIQRGQVIVGRKKLAKELKMSEQQIRSCINRLKSTNEITTKSTNKYTLITIVKYDKFQTNLTDINQQSNQVLNQRVTNKQPTNNQQTTTSNRDKREIKKESKESIYDVVSIESFKDFKDRWLEAGYDQQLVDTAERVLKDNLSETSFNKVMTILTNDSITNPLGYIQTLKMKGEL